MTHSLPAVALFLAIAACGSAVANATGDVDGGPAELAADASVAPAPTAADAGVHDAGSGSPQVCGVAATQVPLESAQAVEDYLGVDRWAWEACGVTDLCPEADPLLLFVHEYESLYMRCGHLCDEQDGGVCATERSAEHPVELVDAGAGRYELRTGFDDLAYRFELTAWSAEGTAIQLAGQLRSGGTFRRANAPAK